MTLVYVNPFEAAKPRIPKHLYFLNTPLLREVRVYLGSINNGKIYVQISRITVHEMNFSISIEKSRLHFIL